MDLQNLDEFITKSNSKKNLNSSNADINNDMESFVHFLKGLFTIDPQLRWNAKTCLKHPFITKEKFDGHFNPNGEEYSQFLQQSGIENSYYSTHNNLNNQRYPHNNQMMNHSMYVTPGNQFNGNNYGNAGNMSMNNSFMSNPGNMSQNSSLDMSCYQYNMKNLPLNMLKNFPYAKIDEAKLKPGATKGNKDDVRGQNQNMNNTFMMTSFDSLNPNNNSFQADYHGGHNNNNNTNNNKYSGNKNLQTLGQNWNHNNQNNQYNQYNNQVYNHNPNQNFNKNLQQHQQGQGQGQGQKYPSNFQQNFPPMNNNSMNMKHMSINQQMQMQNNFMVNIYKYNT